MKLATVVPLALASLLMACGSGATDAPASSGGSATGGAAGGTGGTPPTAGGAGNTGGLNGGAGKSASGACQPSVVQPEKNPNAIALVRAESPPSPGPTLFTSVRVVGDSLVYATNTGLYRMPKSGGMSELVTPSTTNDQLQMAGDTLYWVSGNSLYSVPASATRANATTVIETQLTYGSDYFFAVDATNAYVWIRASRAIQALSLTTGVATTLVEGVESQNWILNGSFIYYAGANETLMRIATTGGQPEKMHQSGHILWSPGVDGEQLYFGGSNILVKVGEPLETELVYSQPVGFIERVVPQGDRLLFEGWQGSVGWVKKDASACGVVVNKTFAFKGWDHDDANFYLALEDTIYKVPF